MKVVPKQDTRRFDLGPILAVGALVVLLAACSPGPAADQDARVPVGNPVQSPAYIATVPLKDGQSPDDAAAALGGVNVTLQGAAGLGTMSVNTPDFALVALDQLPLGSLSADAGEGIVIEANVDRFMTSATLETLKDSTIWAENTHGAVRANGDSTIWAEGDSTIWAEGDSTIWAEGDSTIWAEGDSTIWAEGDSTIWAEGDSTIWAEGGYTYRWMPPNTGLWQRVNLRDAHDEVRNHGLGVVVAVIDTGVDTSHPWLASQLSAAGYDFVDGDNDPSEEGSEADASFGHGTSVVGIIRQIAPRATILPLRALSPDGSGDVLHVVQAVLYAVQQGADIINLSLGGPSNSHALNLALAYAAGQGVFVTTTAGNEGSEQINHPGAMAVHSDFVISVTSVNDKGIKSGFANYHRDVEISAPGELVYGPFPGERMAAWSGTSMAAPVVAGAMALALAENLDREYNRNSAKLAREMFDESSNVYFGSNRQDYNRRLGAGIVDIEEFLDEVLR